MQSVNPKTQENFSENVHNNGFIQQTEINKVKLHQTEII